MSTIQPTQYAYYTYPGENSPEVVMALGFPCEAGKSYAIQLTSTPFDQSSWTDEFTFTVGQKPIVHPVYISLSDGIAKQLVLRDAVAQTLAAGVAKAGQPMVAQVLASASDSPHYAAVAEHLNKAS